MLAPLVSRPTLMENVKILMSAPLCLLELVDKEPFATTLLALLLAFVPMEPLAMLIPVFALQFDPSVSRMQIVNRMNSVAKELVSAPHHSSSTTLMATVAKVLATDSIVG